jgi:hypothetical protein
MDKIACNFNSPLYFVLGVVVSWLSFFYTGQTRAAEMAAGSRRTQESTAGHRLAAKALK